MKTPRGTAAPAPVVAGVPVPPPVARIRVQRISDGAVVLQREDQVVTVTMQRAELVTRKIEEPLLDDDK